MVYLIDPLFDARSLCGLDICRRLSIEPICPPVAPPCPKKKL